MNQPIELEPTEAVLSICRQAWGLSDITFVRKMENYVYSAQRLNQKVFLRLTTPFRRSKTQIEAELHFLGHLAEAGLRVPQVIQNDQGQSLMTIQENGQQYEAVLFSQITGEHPSVQLVTTAPYLEKLGALMASMHQVSQKYEPMSYREHWFEERGIRHALEAAQTSSNSRFHESLNHKMKWIAQLPKTPDTYGLVHADFSYSNLFVDDNPSIGVIDFDDSCYHFFTFDLAVVIFSMGNRLMPSDYASLSKTWTKYLIKGYRTVRPISDEELKQIPKFIQYAYLRSYFWIEYHEKLNTFHESLLKRISEIKEWALKHAG